MKHILSLTLVFLFVTQLCFGQEKEDIEKKPYIEVTGHAEKKIVPDEIYLSITVKERESGRDKISVEQQEKDLKNALSKLNIPIESLTVADAQADYVKVTLMKKDVISQSKYELKLSTAKQVADVFEKLDELKINNAFIARVNHSKIKELKKENEIKAIKSAKTKAEYLLNAIGQKTGNALVIKERNSNHYFIDGIKVRGSSSLPNPQYSKPDMENVKPVQFKKIKLETTIYVKFEIE
ncbi:SIMPL domain-containing protein [Salibacter halophilus]|nr:SIMPL domain-containing protein [Salibacter halophilus]